MATVYKSAQSGSKKQEDEDKRPVVRNKQRVLILCTRGITHRQRHLMNDIEALLPHSKKDTKLDTKSGFDVVNEVAELNNCNNSLLFESRKGQDLYLWAAKTPNGPTVKFLVQNIHTMDELKMTGNCLKGSRPILSFDAHFGHAPHLRLLREMFTQIFGVPKGARKSKPFIDRVCSFTLTDGRVWIRNFQIVEKDPTDPNPHEPSMVEVGPRFVLQPIRIFAGSFRGSVLWENPDYIAPNQIRAAALAGKASKYVKKKTANLEHAKKLESLDLPEDPVADVFNQ
ncbi:Brix domain-containing protein [Piptocephalis cylindrospora]|uniref:Brix domain-containing protein n=1 Tax=Piptocephalis cylindrospora TaxID=1907219 RepID=A0A4P9Y3H1_9FUNG|nr:Brix domain-containing protein [Piptocephalis cylindrospora]|eukprot:RKP13182.1 Brix domain-containing protein [Piptocephalis cylindrospora]